MASIIAVLGIGVFALPAGILGAGFVEEMGRREKPARCPHCGKEIGGT
jgi:voltage-gated potassium channel